MFSMVKQKTIFVCQKCGAQSPKWVGRCPECGQWNSMVEMVVSAKKLQNSKTPKLQKPLRLSQIKKRKMGRIKTGVGEFDRVLGGGIIPGSVVLLAGDPGIGKSTLLTQILAKLGGLYVSGEESPEQVKLRAKRLKIKESQFLILSETNTEAVSSAIEQTKKIKMVVTDSIQTMTTNQLTGTAGSIGQVRESANKLLKIAKKLNIPLFLIGHITKSGAIAGPKVLEHLVDVVLYLEGDKKHDFRILRAYKNRFGATDEVGIFEMSDKGMTEVSNPSKLFLLERVEEVAGSVVVPVLAGIRPVLVEIQALVVPTSLVVPRRIANGVSFHRLQLLCAVLQKRCGLPLEKFDVYLNVAGGLKVDEPAADLGICLAVAASLKNRVVAKDTVFIGEVGLLGEIRKVSQLEKRVKEAKKLGFNNAITPERHRFVNEVIHKILKTS
jgi:DNA repair protein RadA/Sms